MFKNFRTSFGELRAFLILWSTQALSGLGSAMTNFALVLWAYPVSYTHLFWSTSAALMARPAKMAFAS